MVKAMGSEWEPNVFIPASKMIQTLDTPGMQPFLKEFNVSAYGVKVKFLLIIRVVTRYIFSPLIPIFSSKFWSLIPRKFYDPMERRDQVMFPRRRLSFINNN